MPQSFANVDQTKMDLGPCRVTYNGVDLGGTLDNVTVSVKMDQGEIKADQTGTTILDHRVVGLQISVETALAEMQSKDKWKVAFPYMDLLTSGPNKAGLFRNKNGLSLYDVSAQLKLHPLNRADADLSQDYLFYKAAANQDSKVIYGPKEQIKLALKWNIYPDAGQTGQPQLFIGDPAIGLIAAAAGAAVPGGGNVGNGTVTPIAAYSGITKTETITLTCVTAVANGGVFAVSGSLSGALGLATVGISFIPTSPDPAVISFTINDGATDFAVGDTFTIATTSANYS